MLFDLPPIICALGVALHYFTKYRIRWEEEQQSRIFLQIEISILRVCPVDEHGRGSREGLMNKYNERSRMYTLDNDNTVIDKHTVGQVTNCLEKHERTRRKSRVPEDNNETDNRSRWICQKSGATSGLPGPTRRVQSVGGPLKRGFQFRRAETNPSGAGPYSRNHQPGLEARDEARERDRCSQSLSLSLRFEAVPF